jgi:hypothetical protein
VSIQSDALPKRVKIKILTMSDLATVTVDFSPLDQEGGLFLRRSFWFPLVMSDPVILHSSMAFAAAMYQFINKGCLSNPALLSLRQRAISAINKSLPDPAARPSDPLIGAVFYMCAPLVCPPPEVVPPFTFLSPNVALPLRPPL